MILSGSSLCLSGHEFAVQGVVTPPVVNSDGLYINGTQVLSAAGTYATDFATPATIEVVGAGNYTLSGVISGADALTVAAGANTITLTGANTFAGGVDVTSGTVAAGPGGYGTGTVTLGTAQTGASNVAARIGLAGGQIVTNNVTVANLGTGTATILGGSSNGSCTGIVTLNRDVRFVNSSGGGGWALNGTVQGMGNIIISADAATTTTPAPARSISAGSALVTTSYSGQWIVERGALRISKNSAISTNATPVVLGNATSVTNASNNPNEILTLIGSSTSTILPNTSVISVVRAWFRTERATTPTTYTGNLSVGAGGTITLNSSAGGTHTLSGVISGAGALVSDTSGTFILTGTNTYTGSTTVNAGTLQLANGSTGSIDTTSGVTVNGGALFGISRSGATYTFSRPISGAGGFVKNNVGTAILSGVNTYTGSTLVNAGILQAGSTTAFGSNSAVTIENRAGTTLALNNFNVSIGSLAGGGSTGGNVTLGSGILTTGGINTSTSYGGVISGAGGLIKTGSGTQTFTGSNTYTGGTTVSQGTLDVKANAAAAGAITGAITLGDANSGSNNITLVVDGNLSYARSGVLTISAAGSGVKTVHSENGTPGGIGAHWSGGIVFNGATVMRYTNQADGYRNGSTWSGAGHVTIEGGTAYTYLAGNKSAFSGGITVNLFGVDLRGSYGGALTVGSAGAVWLVGNESFSIINGSGTIAALGRSGTSTKNLTVQSGTFSGVLSNDNGAFGQGSLGPTPLALVKSGSGTLTLSGANTYSGGSTVSVGTLTAGSLTAFGSGAITVASGATLNRGGFAIANTISGAGTIV